MASVVPRLALSPSGGTHLNTLGLVPSPRRQSHPPTDLKAPPSPDLEASEPFEQDEDNFYSLKIPSPTYRIMFTPRFLIASCDSEDDYSDGISNNSAGDFTFEQGRLPPWSSTAEHVKPVVKCLIDEERRRHDSVRLAWRPILLATPTASTPTLGLDTSSSDALETQSSSWVPCASRLENPAIDSQEMSPLLRRTQSLPGLLSGSSQPREKISDLSTIWNSVSVYSSKDKEDEIKRWAADIKFTR